MMSEHRFLGKTSKEYFVIRGINVFSERWNGAGGCATVTNPQDNCTYTFSKYICKGVEFIAGRDKHGYWLFFSA